MRLAIRVRHRWRAGRRCGAGAAARASGRRNASATIRPKTRTASPPTPTNPSVRRRMLATRSASRAARAGRSSRCGVWCAPLLLLLTPLPSPLLPGYPSATAGGGSSSGQVGLDSPLQAPVLPTSRSSYDALGKPYPPRARSTQPAGGRGHPAVADGRRGVSRAGLSAGRLVVAPRVWRSRPSPNMSHAGLSGELLASGFNGSDQSHCGDDPGRGGGGQVDVSTARDEVAQQRVAG